MIDEFFHPVDCESSEDSDHVVIDGTPDTGSHWHWRTKEFGKPVLAVDFHHVITTRCSACPGEKLQDTETNGEVQKGCIESLTELHKTYKIMIYTGAGEFWDENRRKVGVEDWLRSHGVPFDEIRYGKPPACFIIDDRAVHHQGWDSTLAEIRQREKMKTHIIHN